MKKLPILLLALLSFAAYAQTEPAPEFTDDYLDTVQVRKSDVINNYSMIGVNFGVTFSQMSFNPPMRQEMLFNPQYFSIMFTHHEKLFDLVPNYAFQIGIAYGKEGYRFKADKQTGAINNIDGATEAVMSVVEVPALAMFHADAGILKIMACAGFYGGYRIDITRSGGTVSPDLVHSFKDTDIRFDYGLQGGAGIAFMFDPVELHFNALVRYSWSSIYTPDSSPGAYSKYYYRYAYPFDVMVTAGLHFQLSKRKGKTSAMLRREAREIVEERYGINENQGSKNR